MGGLHRTSFSYSKGTYLLGSEKRRRIFPGGVDHTVSVTTTERVGMVVLCDWVSYIMMYSVGVSQYRAVSCVCASPTRVRLFVCASFAPQARDLWPSSNVCLRSFVRSHVCHEREKVQSPDFPRTS
jgi:hypothetical protein